MSRVLFLVNHDVVIYNFRLELVERLLRDGHEVFISSPYGERIDELINMGCCYYDTNISRHGMNPLDELKLLKYYKKLLKKVRPDIVFTYTIKPNIYGGIACKKMKIPYIANITGLGTAVENKGLLQKITIKLYKISLNRAKMVFFQNSENVQFFNDHKITLNKYSLLPGSGVNLERFGVLSYPDDEIVEFVFISRIMKDKGIEQYLEAAEYIRKKHPKTKFHICGFCEEAYEQRLKDLSEQKVIIYHGLVRDIREVLSYVHCTVHPTYYPEGMSNVLLESCACARPIITTDRSGCREIVDEGLNGFVVRPKDTGDLIMKIEKFLTLTWDQKKNMGISGRRKVEKEFDRRIVVDAYMSQI